MLGESTLFSSLQRSISAYIADMVISCRHYVAFIRRAIPDKQESWVLYNDEKVVQAEGDVDEMKKFAYVYFFERV